MTPRKRAAPSFQKAHNFSRVHHSNKWTCNLCSDLGQLNPQQALLHESSAEHSKNAATNEPNWWGPLETNWDEAWAQPIEDVQSKEALKDREHRSFADQVDDLVPFWIRAVKAAEHGEVLKLSDFLESLEHRDIWPPRVPNSWRNPEAQSLVGGKGGSGEGRWGANWDLRWGSGSGADSGSSCGSHEHNADELRGEMSRERTKKGTWGVEPNERNDLVDLHDFVEEFATQEAADAHRRHEMRVFVELPTAEKVKRIDDLIRTLHGLQDFRD